MLCSFVLIKKLGVCVTNFVKNGKGKAKYSENVNDTTFIDAKLKTPLVMCYITIEMLLKEIMHSYHDSNKKIACKVSSIFRMIFIITKGF